MRLLLNLSCLARLLSERLLPGKCSISPRAICNWNSRSVDNSARISAHFFPVDSIKSVPTYADCIHRGKCAINGDRDYCRRASVRHDYTRSLLYELDAELVRGEKKVEI